MTNAPLVRTILHVPDISCSHCAQTVTGALTPLDGVVDVAVDLSARTVQIAYDPHRVTLERISEVLAAEAYPVAAIRDERSAS